MQFMHLLKNPESIWLRSWAQVIKSTFHVLSEQLQTRNHNNHIILPNENIKLSKEVSKLTALSRESSNNNDVNLSSSTTDQPIQSRRSYKKFQVKISDKSRDRIESSKRKKKQIQIQIKHDLGHKEENHIRESTIQGPNEGD